MAQRVDEGKFWLPSEFLTDDELLMGFKADRLNDFRRGYTSSFGFSSGLSSPAEPLLGSAETESDEDDYVTALTQKLADATLGDWYLSAENTMVGLSTSHPFFLLFLFCFINCVRILFLFFICFW